jgi:hypothetical protein
LFPDKSGQVVTLFAFCSYFLDRKVPLTDPDRATALNKFNCTWIVD